MGSVGEPVRLVVHGHFYQPPRENPWTEEVPVEPSAAPFHDWNERITAECYRPNGWARVVDEHGRIETIVDNYEHLSFDAGPTLLSWLETHHPDVLARMVAADAAAGGGIAQAYNHSILPLAPERDVRTQIRWGLADFVHRFGRPASALWLPETAVNDAVLQVLVDEGVGATILAPGQAAAVRPLGAGDDAWHDVDATTVATGVPHLWKDPQGRSIAVVFYDGPLSHDLAFALTGLSSQDLVARVVDAAADGTPVLVATDGETFGHHHKFADRALAYAFEHEAPANSVRTGTLAELVAEVPASHEVRVRESSWSCFHGVGRWREDCGCSTGGEPGWNQAWRAPLRAALDILRDHATEVFERRGREVFDDPWSARDAYVDVLSGATGRTAFTDAWVREGADATLALALLESQRQALLMYTSCGWFFNDLAGLETVQVLRYAARLVDLLFEIDEPAPVDSFLDVLEGARSNRPEEGTGRDIWVRTVEPSRVDAGRVVAHLALLDLLEGREAGGTVGGHVVLSHERRQRRRGGIVGSAGRVELEHRRTGRRTAHVYAAVRLAGLQVVGASRLADAARDDDCFSRLDAATGDGSRLTDVLRVIDECFGPAEFGLDAALPDAAGDIVASAASALTDRVGAALEQLWLDNRAVLDSLVVAGHPLDPDLRAPIELAVGRRLRASLAEVAGPVSDAPEAAANAARAASDAAWEARRLGVTGSARVAAVLADAVLAATRRALAEPDVPEWPQLVSDLLALRRPLRTGIDLDRAQELVVEALTTAPGDEQVARLAVALGVAVP
jgi:hypothetical protein